MIVERSLQEKASFEPFVHEDAQRIAENLGSFAKKRSQEEDISTPYQKRCLKYFDIDIEGGRPDDITVVVAWVARA